MTRDEAIATVCAPGSLFEIADGEVSGVPMKLFANCPDSITALYGLAALNGDAEFVIFEDERWTVADTLAQAGRIGHALVAEYGVGKGDRVALAMRNFPEWISSFIAITSIGAVAVPLNAWWQTDELRFGLEDSGAKVMMADPRPVRTCHCCGGRGRPQDDPGSGPGEDEVPSGTARLEDILSEDATMPVVDIKADDNMMILYTSGTTGRPKGAVSTHRAVLSALLSFSSRASIGALMEPPPENAPEAPKTSFILAVPLFHVTGLIPVMLGSTVSGSKLVMMYRWDPERALELIEREKVTNFVGVPTMSWDLLESPDFAIRDTSSLRSVGGGGAPAPPELVKRIEEEFANGRPGIGYGMTETNAYGPQNSGDEYVERPTSCGWPVPTMQLRVTDPDLNVLGPGEVGEIWFKGPNLISGYWNRPDATAETIIDGWLRSGDIGRIEEDGFVYVVDRAKDMVLRGGENIYCAEVEAAIYEHPAVYEAAVYGVPHERLGEELAAHIMVKEGETLDAGELQNFVGERLAGFKVPTRITFVSESLPRNASGKILKRELRDGVAG